MGKKEEQVYDDTKGMETRTAPKYKRISKQTVDGGLLMSEWSAVGIPTAALRADTRLQTTGAGGTRS